MRVTADCTLYEVHPPIEQSSQGHGSAVSLLAISVYLTYMKSAVTVVNCQLSISNYQLPITNYQLPIT
ncbi:MAG: hypothetical protein HC894_16675, partial [Microcoleus sp. SM1_3_4]|nr:hypothetical protein [Microcoleus sp. SM1_3_4]